TIAPECAIEYVGIRPGEKLHEVLVSEDEARNTVELSDMYVIQPSHSWWSKENWKTAQPLPDGFRYGSDSNEQWMTSDELEELIGLASGAGERPQLLAAQRARA